MVKETIIGLGTRQLIGDGTKVQKRNCCFLQLKRVERKKRHWDKRKICIVWADSERQSLRLDLLGGKSRYLEADRFSEQRVASRRASSP